ncbi:MAG: MerR family transcriptional regulator [Lachnospiraceae bacterium]|nr:MerR family transcriptional regulator [Lachnospiraceae bacterium]
MSKYTTGEIAKICGVSVRTVQYYDSRNILIPTELSEGGRRLYSEEDLKRMKIICFLRDVGISINSIDELLSEENPGSVISVLLEQQEQMLKEELEERQTKLKMLEQIKRELKSVDNFSVESIGDIAYAMENKKNMKRLHAILLSSGIPIGILQWSTIIYWIVTGIWWPCIIYVLLAIPYAVWISNFYFKRVAYICPQCHEIFKPVRKEAFWAKHTPTLRKLTCTCCGYKGFCIETYGKEDIKYGKA